VGWGWYQPFAVFARELYDLAGASAVWPPVPLGVDDDGLLKPNQLTMKQAADALFEVRRHQLINQTGAFDVNSRIDESPPWYDIPAITKRTRLTDTAWATMLCASIRAEMNYPRCDGGPTAGSMDHSHRCHKCGGPYRYARHQAVLAAMRATALDYGLSATDNFFTALGVWRKEKQPDILFYRTGTDDRPLVLDIAVPHQSLNLTFDACQKTFAVKRRKYERWNDDAVEFAPFIVSTIASLHPMSWKVLQRLESCAARRGFARDCAARIKIALASFEVYRRHALNIRHQAGRLIQQEPAMPTTANEDEEEADEAAEADQLLNAP
jgi:hypothetical protein